MVDERRWISEERFLHALNYCMLLPGPEAMQLATYVGWLMHRTLGGLIAGLLFVLPGFISILALSMIYATFGDVAVVTGLFAGLKPAVLAIVVQALVRIGRRALRNKVMVAIAAAAWLAMFFFDVHFPWVILGAAVVGAVGHWIAPGRLRVEHAPANSPAALSAPAAPALVRVSESDGPTRAAPQVDRALESGAIKHAAPSVMRSIATAAIWLLVWWAPLLAVMWASGADSIYSRQAVFFSKTAVVAFGGAYAVLAYVAQRAVEDYVWLSPTQMLDGLALAETTPGPLIMVLQFVGFVAAYQQASGLHPLIAGVIASVVTTWATFAPCFLWIFVGAPWIEHLRAQRWLSSALGAITAAVVGVIANLTAWLALRTLFGTVHVADFGPLRLQWPEGGSIHRRAWLIAAVAALLIFRFRMGMLTTLAIAGTLGVVLGRVGG